MERAKEKNLDAAEVEAINMIARGFEDLSLLNSRLAYSTIVDLLLSMNDNDQARENLSTTFRQRLTGDQMAKLANAGAGGGDEQESDCGSAVWKVVGGVED